MESSALFTRPRACRAIPAAALCLSSLLLCACPDTCPQPCTGGARCVAGTCRQPCTVDTDCDRGHICARGYCEPGNRPPGATDAALDAGIPDRRADSTSTDLHAIADAHTADQAAHDTTTADTATVDLGAVDVHSADTALVDVPSSDAGQLDARLEDAGPPDVAGSDTLLLCSPAGSACDDSDPMTHNDTCVAGECRGYESSGNCTPTCPATCSSGECCEGRCTDAGCTCGHGCSCNFTLEDQDRVTCEQEARCHAEASGWISFMCMANSSCELVCQAGATCLVDCLIDGLCMIHCPMGSTCQIRTCEPRIDCDGGVVVCNRECP